MEVIKKDRKMIMKSTTWMEVQLKRSSRRKHKIRITEAPCWAVNRVIGWLSLRLLLLFTEPQFQVQWELGAFNAFLKVSTINCKGNKFDINFLSLHDDIKKPFRLAKCWKYAQTIIQLPTMNRRWGNVSKQKVSFQLSRLSSSGNFTDD